ncbi:polymerase (DNA directed), delta 1, catalytic subunit [Acanthamoeba castellanii str. Neff]|uniref:DNA polymerase n=1 Tax=Acanthamoeba castellanii (strain ATCC 30010 / Neff) TaxID=1257118 RepID=L8HIY3_ACACF|nr:polymerase (DNA directed), delta 1, catalytic subunit [Acanthamoeba castellanii str. Neff]ELR25172.1 polymerase (DNA directed), delta 1, catalytic subunit [Acanthamoeba castellanii str. Neff]
MADWKEGPVPIIHMYGLTREGHSVLVHLHGVLPYFYVPAPHAQFSEDDCESFRLALNRRCASHARGAKERKDYVIAVAVEQKESIMGYHADKRKPFLRITMAMPPLVPAARGILEAGLVFDGYPNGRTFQTYESNIAFVLRFMIDKKMTGAAWLELAANKYEVVPDDQKVSHCQFELHAKETDITGHAPEGVWSDIAPFRVLSFDIECAGRRGVFPEPEMDPVIQIANVVSVQGENGPIVKNVFTVKKCSPIAGAEVRCYRTEAEMLLAWRKFVEIVDPDILTGYNIINFDIWYLLTRAQKLGLVDFPFWGRIKAQRSTMKDTTFSSKAFGKRDSKEIKIGGRVQLDVLLVITRDYKLRSYTLNYVSQHFLEEQKEDVHHSIITDLYNGTNDQRRRLAVYCIKDALLPQRLLDKLMCIINYIEMARVTGVPIAFLLTRGQQIKVLSQLYRIANTEDLLIPAVKVAKPTGEDGKGYKGAIVIAPKTAYYDVPIATLDFASLYPSIMIAHNLCYSTLLAPGEVNSHPPESYERSPGGECFVREETKPGLLPRILNGLLEARARAKAEMKKETNPFKQAVLNGRQLALKVSANSVYGFTGATIGKLPCLAISSAVTAYGREMIEKTQATVLERYRVENGYSHTADVIYGDTDSVMVNFGVKTVEEAMKLGREAAEYITKHCFEQPIKLEFEKVYYPYLLISKKRYAGLWWGRPDKYDHMDAKGIETVRRDNCALVRNVVQECLDRILIERNIDSAVDYVKQIISDLLCNRLDLSLLVITKQISRNSEDYKAKQAHVELAERMAKRDAGSAPVVGDRVPYVIVKGAKGSRAYERAEDPLHVLEHNIPLDAQYYLHQQLEKPLLRIFKPILKNPESLLTGEHTRTISVQTPTVGGIVSFAKRTLSCMGCKAPLVGGETSVCRYCRPMEAVYYQERLARVHRLEQEFASAWTQCQRCQGSFHETVLCTSCDCPIFYMRKKIQKDLADSHSLLLRFDPPAASGSGSSLSW